MEYKVDLGHYSGPMDLLLYLVRRHELDVCEVSLAKVTHDFQQFLGLLEILDLDMIGDFVVVASILLEIKSREVLPKPEEEHVDEDVIEESSSDLIAQLMQYKRYKNAARTLDDRASRVAGTLSPV